MTGLRRAWGDLLRAAARRRWLLAAGLVAAAVATALPSLAPAPAAATTVLSAARDLAAGTPLTKADVVALALPPDAVPSGALSNVDQVVGRLSAGPVRAGEPLTDVRVVGPGLLRAVDGAGELVAVPVRLADPAAAALLRPGDRVDVLAASTDPATAGTASVTAAGAPVLAVPAPDAQAEGALVVLATPPATAARLAATAVTSRLSVVVRS